MNSEMKMVDSDGEYDSASRTSDNNLDEGSSNWDDSDDFWLQ
jgi:hypothetical protein